MATDSAYEQQIAALDTRRKNEELNADTQQQTIESSYGFDPKYASDPYTTATLLARASAARFSRSTNSYAARRGGLYSGALSSQRESDAFTSGLERDTALKEYASQIAGVQNQRLESQSNYAQGSASAYGDLTSRLTSTPAEPVEPPGGAGGGSPTRSPDAIAKAQAILKNPQGKTKAAIAWAKSVLGR